MLETPKAAPGLHSDSLDRDAAALHAAVAELVRVYQFRDRDRICCHDISVTQCHALETLVEHGPLRLSAVAERLFLDKSTTSRVIGALVKKGYVTQRPEPADRRATLLEATARGRRLCARITDEMIGQQKVLVEEMAPAVRAGVIQVIRALAQAADARFRSGVSVAGHGGCCSTGEDAAPSGA